MSQREKEILEKTIEILKKYLAPDKIILFGSRGKKKSQKGSDFDFAVDHHKPDIRTERKISEEIEEVVGLYGVDIVYLKSIDNAFRSLIFKTGKVIYERRD